MNGKTNSDGLWGKGAVRNVILASGIALVGGLLGGYVILKTVTPPTGPCKGLGDGKYAVCCLEAANCNVDDDVRPQKTSIMLVANTCEMRCFSLALSKTNCQGTERETQLCAGYDTDCSRTPGAAAICSAFSQSLPPR